MPSDHRVSIVMVPEGYPHIIRPWNVEFFRNVEFYSQNLVLSIHLTVFQNELQLAVLNSTDIFLELCIGCVWYLCRINLIFYY